MNWAKWSERLLIETAYRTAERAICERLGICTTTPTLVSPIHRRRKKHLEGRVLTPPSRIRDGSSAASN
jgi:hypothetical protein